MRGDRSGCPRREDKSNAPPIVVVRERRNARAQKKRRAETRRLRDVLELLRDVHRIQGPADTLMHVLKVRLGVNVQVSICLKAIL